jgi:hypothetical protein
MVTKKQKKKMSYRKKKSPEDKKSMKNLWLGLVIVVVMISSVFAFGMMNSSSGGAGDLKYNGYNFKYSDGLFILKMDDKVMSFLYHPKELDNINLSNSIKTRLRNTVQIDATSNIEDLYKNEIAVSQLYLQETLSMAGYKFVRIGFTTETEYENEVITCQDATAVVPVLFYKDSEETEIIESEGCILIKGSDSRDFHRITAKIIYVSLGIIE